MRAPQRFRVLVAADEASIAGYATLLFQFSPWLVREYLFLDDLYVARSRRGDGIGRLLMRRVAEIAIEHGVDAPAELRDRFIAYWPRDAMRALLEGDDPRNVSVS